MAEQCQRGGRGQTDARRKRRMRSVALEEAPFYARRGTSSIKRGEARLF